MSGDYGSTEEQRNDHEKFQASFSPAVVSKWRILIYLARNGDAGLPKHVSDLRVSANVTRHIQT